MKGREEGRHSAVSGHNQLRPMTYLRELIAEALEPMLFAGKWKERLLDLHNLSPPKRAITQEPVPLLGSPTIQLSLCRVLGPTPECADKRQVAVWGHWSLGFQAQFHTCQ